MFQISLSSMCQPPAEPPMWEKSADAVKHGSTNLRYGRNYINTHTLALKLIPNHRAGARFFGEVFRDPAKYRIYPSPGYGILVAIYLARPRCNRARAPRGRRGGWRRPSGASGTPTGPPSAASTGAMGPEGASHRGGLT